MCVKTIVPNTVGEAVDLLYPRHNLWGDDPSQWIFRGQSHSEWPLLPSAYRDDALLYDPSTRRMVRGRKGHILAQINAEWGTLRHFLAQVDRMGLPFARPDDALFNAEAYFEKYAPLFNRIKTGNTEEWPPADILPNLGLAQHYGVHTRLLDWTTSSYVAGYFAACGGARNTKSPKRAPADWKAFTVWAFRADFINFSADLGNRFARLIRVPRSSNPNLHAQSGIFILYWDGGIIGKPEDVFNPPTFDDVVERVFKPLTLSRKSEVSAYDPPLIRIDIPGRFAPSVLEALATQGHSAATYFPGYVGAAQAVNEHEYWP